MLRYFIFFSFVLLSLLGCSQELPQRTQQVCKSEFIDGISASWCVESEIGKQSDQVVYYLHGIMDDEYRWSKTAIRSALYMTAIGQNKVLPTVVSISIGKFWFLTPDRRFLGVLDSNLKVVAESIIPRIEKDLNIEIKSRIIVGESMGSFNAFQIAANYPSMWSKAAMLCPAFLPVGPHSSPLEMAAYLKRNPHAEAKKLLAVFPLALIDFPTTNSWNLNNPILISKYLNAFPVSFIASNGWDQYGFNEGALLVANNLHQQGLTVHYATSPETGHCVHDEKVLQQFSDFILGN
jgi:pimeloyl-ACP methyl ester carboxylesterase